MECPRDKQEMEYQGFFKYPRHACPACKGLFVAERDVTENIGYAGPRKFEAVAEVKVDNLADSKISCPKGCTTMKAVRFADAEIDICPSCSGMWLDSGEFQKIMARTQQSFQAKRPNPKQPEPETELVSGATIEGVLDVLETAVRSVWRATRRMRRY